MENQPIHMEISPENAGFQGILIISLGSNSLLGIAGATGQGADLSVEF